MTAALVDQKLDVIVSMQFKQARSPASACLQRTQQSLAARPPRKGRTLARPSYLGRGICSYKNWVEIVQRTGKKKLVALHSNTINQWYKRLRSGAQYWGAVQIHPPACTLIPPWLRAVILVLIRVSADLPFPSRATRSVYSPARRTGGHAHGTRTGTAGFPCSPHGHDQLPEARGAAHS